MTFRDSYELVRDLLAGERGQTMAEYGVVLAVITIGVITAIGVLATAIAGRLGSITGLI